MTPSEQQAVENVYVAFGDVPRPASVDGCECCISEAALDALLAKPLRQLSPDELSRYVSSALLTVGSPEDFLYFLPRILEILVLEPSWWPSQEVVARAIYESGFPVWRPVHREALLAYFDAIFDVLLARLGGDDLDGWLCALGTLEQDVRPVLARIAREQPRLVEFYESNSRPLQKNRLANSFWDYAPAARQQVVEWFQSAETQGLIEAAYGLA